MDDRLFSIEDIALLYNVSSSTVRRWIRSGKLVGQKAGAQWRFDPSAVRKTFEQGMLSGATRPLLKQLQINTVHEPPEWARPQLARWREFLESVLEQTKPDHVVANDRRGAKIWAMTMPGPYIWGHNLWHSTALDIMAPEELKQLFARRRVLVFDEMIQHGREMHNLRKRLADGVHAQVTSAVCVRRRSHAESGELLEYEALACEDVDDELFAKRATFISQLAHLFEPPLDVDHLVVQGHLAGDLGIEGFLEKLSKWGIPFIVWFPDREHRFMAITLDRPQFFDTANIDWLDGLVFAWQGPCKIRFYVDVESRQCFCSFIVYPEIQGLPLEWAQVSSRSLRTERPTRPAKRSRPLALPIEDATSRHLYCSIAIRLAVKLLDDFVASGAANDVGISLINRSDSVELGLLRGTFGPRLGDEIGKRTREILARSTRAMPLIPQSAQMPPQLYLRERGEPQAENFDSFGCRTALLKAVPLKYATDDSHAQELLSVSYQELLSQLPEYSEITIGRVLDYELDKGTVKPVVQITQHASQDGAQRVRLRRAFCRGEFGVWFEWDRTALTHHDTVIQRTLGVGPTIVEQFAKRIGTTSITATHFDKLFANMQHDLREGVHDLLYVGWRPYKYGPMPVVPALAPSGEYMEFRRFLVELGGLTEAKESHGSQTWRRYEPTADSWIPWQKLYRDQTTGVTRAHLAGLVRLYAAIQQECKTVRRSDPRSSGLSILSDPLVVLATARNGDLAYKCGWYEVYDWRAKGDQILFPLLNALAQSDTPPTQPVLKRYLEDFAAPAHLLYDKIEMYRNLPLLREQIVSLLNQGDFEAGEVLLETVELEPRFESQSARPMQNLEWACHIMRAFTFMTRQVLTACQLDQDSRKERTKDSSFYLRELLTFCPELTTLQAELRNCIDESRNSLLTEDIAACLTKAFRFILTVFDSQWRIPDPRPQYEQARERLQIRDGLLVRLQSIAMPDPYALAVADIRNLRNLPYWADIFGGSYDQALDNLLNWVGTTSRDVVRRYNSVILGGLPADNVILAGSSADEVFLASLDLIRETTRQLATVDRNQLATFGLLRVGIAWHDDTLGGEFKGVRPGIIAHDLGEKPGRDLGAISLTETMYDRLAPQHQSEFDEANEGSGQGKVFVRLWNTSRDSEQAEDMPV